MVRITEELIRKRAEHNEGEIFSLEELSLHQQNLERIELLDKLCRDLKILYLQNNLIPKIENVSRLKKLEYLNLALNNIERIENLEGCESLRKLDLTVNFVGDLTSIECLVDLYALEEIYLTGNPCADYPNYRHYVIATLPQLQKLDGVDISKSERIVALQNLEQIRPVIRECQEKQFQKRMKEKSEAANRRKKLQDKLASCDGSEFDSTVKEFWDEKVPFTPEARVETHEYMQMQEEAKNRNKEKEKPKRRAPRLFANDGRPLNVNEPKISFKLTEEQVEGQDAFILDVSVYRHMETALLDCDVQPNYVRVSLKKKVLQLVLPEEVQPDRSEAKRSQTTGHLVITMPKVTQLLRAASTRTQLDSPRAHRKAALRKRTDDSEECLAKQPFKALLDDECNTGASVDWRSIISSKNKEFGSKNRTASVRRCNAMLVRSRSNSPDFVDCPEVPPLV